MIGALLVPAASAAPGSPPDRVPATSCGPTDHATAVLALFRHLTSRRAVLVIVDDLPSIDAASARMLSFALRRLREEPAGLLTAVRTDSSADPRRWLPSAPRRRSGRHPAQAAQSGGEPGAPTHPDGILPGRSLLLQIHDKSGEPALRAGTGGRSPRQQPARPAGYGPHARFAAASGARAGHAPAAWVTRCAPGPLAVDGNGTAGHLRCREQSGHRLYRSRSRDPAGC